jgi:glycine betaine catabolism B
MALKQAGHVLGDLARAGLVLTQKAIVHALADERAVSPAMVSDLVGRLHPHRIPVEVVRIVQETGSTRTFRLAPAGGDPFPPFRAGQFINLFLTVDGVATSRPYSISSPPDRSGFVEITVRQMTVGFVSRFLCERVRVGDRFSCSGPAGFFVHEPLVDTRRLVFLAGGCGITPFMSMIRNAADARSGVEMHLLYGNRSPDDVIFGEELDRLAREMETLRVDRVISEPPEGYEGITGFLDADRIRQQVGEVEGRTFFLCGPHAMYDLCAAALRELNVPARRIKKELSGPLPDITRVRGWPEGCAPDQEFRVTIQEKGTTFQARSGEPLLNSLERNGVAVDCLCRSGECGVCRIRLLEGKVFMPETAALRATDAAFGYIHSCAAYPLSDIVLRL